MSQAPINDKELAIATSSKDGYVANISKVNRMAHEGKSFSGNERNCVFLNRGNGTFATVSALSGWDMPDDSRGIALFDWDHDGKVDFLTTNRNAPRVRMMHNQIDKAGNWIGFQLIGRNNKNRDAIGARVQAKLKSGRTIIRTLRAGEGFASQSSKRIQIGLGSAEKISQLTVVWPDGQKAEIPVPAVNQYYQIWETDNRISPMTFPKPAVRSALSHHGVDSQKQGYIVPLQIPIPAPNLRYSSNGEQKLLPMSALKKPLLVCLWSQSCEDCRTKFKQLTAQAQFVNQHFDVLALCIDKDKQEQAKGQQFLKQINFPWLSGVPSKASNMALARIFTHTLSSIQDLPTPSSLLISTDGTVTTLIQGSHTSKQDISGLLGKPTQRRWLQPPSKINLLYLPRILMDHGTLEDTADYVSRAHSKLLDHKEYCVLLAWVAGEFLKRNQTQMAASYFKVAHQTGQNNAVVMNNVAWVYATNKNAQLRNGKLAVNCALRAVKLTRGQNAGYLDTLAAAHAETGNFPLAIATANKAIEVAQQHRQHALIPSIKKSINHYQHSQPIRE